MAAITRWVQYLPASTGFAGDGNGSGCKGTRGRVIATTSVGDTFNIGPTTNRLYINIDGDGEEYITLYSGSELDPRFIAKDITEKIKLLYPQDEAYTNASCEWGNHHSTTTSYTNCFRLYSGTLGSSNILYLVLLYCILPYMGVICKDKQ